MPTLTVSETVDRRVIARNCPLFMLTPFQESSLRKSSGDLLLASISKSQRNCTAAPLDDVLTVLRPCCFRGKLAEHRERLTVEGSAPLAELFQVRAFAVRDVRAAAVRRAQRLRRASPAPLFNHERPAICAEHGHRWRRPAEQGRSRRLRLLGRCYARSRPRSRSRSRSLPFLFPAVAVGHLPASPPRVLHPASGPCGDFEPRPRPLPQSGRACTTPLCGSGSPTPTTTARWSRASFRWRCSPSCVPRGAARNTFTSRRCCGWVSACAQAGAAVDGRGMWGGMLRAVRPCGCAAMPCAAALTRWTPCPRQPRPADHHFTLHGADKVVDTLTLTRLPVQMRWTPTTTRRQTTTSGTTGPVLQKPLRPCPFGPPPSALPHAFARCCAAAPVPLAPTTHLRAAACCLLLAPTACCLHCSFEQPCSSSH
jgi:hypothetical protein